MNQFFCSLYEDLPFSQNLKKMVAAFPMMSEEHLSLTLEKQQNDLPTALVWMQSVVDIVMEWNQVSGNGQLFIPLCTLATTID